MFILLFCNHSGWCTQDFKFNDILYTIGTEEKQWNTSHNYIKDQLNVRLYWLSNNFLSLLANGPSKRVRLEPHFVLLYYINRMHQGGINIMKYQTQVWPGNMFTSLIYHRLRDALDTWFASSVPLGRTTPSVKENLMHLWTNRFDKT